MASKASKREKAQDANELLDRIFSTAHSDREKTFFETAKYSDIFGTTDLFVANTDFALDNPEKKAKSNWAEKLDYSSGIVCLSTVKHSARKYQNSDRKDFYHIAAIPLEDFTRIFANGPEFAKRLTNEGRTLMEEWVDVNGSPEMVNRRTPVESRIDLLTVEWKGENNRHQQAVLELQLNTFGFTQENMGYPQANDIRLRDIKVEQKG